MGGAQSDTYSSLFIKSDNVNLDETFDRKSALVHVLIITSSPFSKFNDANYFKTVILLIIFLNITGGCMLAAMMSSSAISLARTL